MNEYSGLWFSMRRIVRVGYPILALEFAKIRGLSRARES